MLPLFLLLVTGSLYSDTDCPDSSVPTYLAHPTDCSKYYECIRGHKYEASCSDGLEWDDSNKYCDESDYVQCSTTTTTVSPDDSVCQSIKETSYVVYPDDCSKYYKCTDGHSNILSCPENMFFNAESNVCDYMDNVSCDLTTKRTPGTSTTSTSTTTTTTRTTTTPVNPTTVDPVCPSAKGTSNVVYPQDCSKYYRCINGQSNILTCPENMLFNPETNQCDYMDKVSCDSTSPRTSGSTTTTTSTPATTATTKTTTTTTVNPTTVDPVCPSVEGTSNVVYPDDCSKYYRCINGQSNLLSCPENMLFNPETSQCDYMDNVSCDSTSPRTSGSTTTTTLAPTTTTTTKTTTSTTPDSTSPRTSGSTTTTTSAPATTTTKTTTTTTPETTVEPTSQRPDSGCEGAPDGTYIPDPTDCRKFFACVNQHGVPFSCPSGEIWDAIATTCVKSDTDC